ncbi:MAG: efflux RND transporter periplasmic adaptor subunit [Alphaproteobacteria bacterium]|nr:efflux RND transporter periplasmic adaptor subunit [Alphaproteobacteria bacterium]
MSPRACIFLIAVAITAAAGGFWAGTNQAPLSAAAPSPPASGPVIYFRDPDGKPAYSAEPRSTADGRAYVAVRASEDLSFDDAAVPSASPQRRVRYYRNPMGLPDVSATPKKDWMGMDYIPVYEDEAGDDGGTITLSPERIQRSGVRTERVERRVLSRALVVPGTIRIDEARVHVVALRAEGFVEELYVARTGQSVTAGEKLFRAYIPQLQQAQVDLLQVLGERNLGTAEQQRLVQGAQRKLRNLGVSEGFIRIVVESRSNVRTIDWPAPMTGTVLEKRIVVGQRAMAGDELYRIADLSEVWVIADVPESELGAVRVGDRASVVVRTYPGESREARVDLVYPELKAETRTARIRLVLPNRDGRLRAEMYADVTLREGEAAAPTIAVSDGAVIDSGRHQIVLVARGDGRFEPRPVKLGRRGDGHVEILDGLVEGVEVVSGATFLIDAESNLRAALRGLSAPETPR